MRLNKQLRILEKKAYRGEFNRLDWIALIAEYRAQGRHSAAASVERKLRYYLSS